MGKAKPKAGQGLDEATLARELASHRTFTFLRSLYHEGGSRHLDLANRRVRENYGFLVERLVAAGILSREEVRPGFVRVTLHPTAMTRLRERVPNPPGVRQGKPLPRQWRAR